MTVDPLTGLDARLGNIKGSQKFDREKRAVFVASVKAGSTRTAAAETAGVSLATVRKTLGLDPDFEEAVRDAEESKFDIAETALLEALRDREPWAVRYTLDKQEGLRKRWKSEPERVEVDVLAEIGPGLERVRALEGRLRERQAVLDVSGRESEYGSEDRGTVLEVAAGRESE